MIGSIGAESRYSTGYNNLKPNRNQNKWADTLAQTVDKEDISSRADINRAKKSTVMDSYLALSGKTINTLKQEYSEYESENYRIVPDNEAECFDIYNKDGERLGAFSYSDIKIRQDETTGKQFLISEHGTMSYDALADSPLPVLCSAADMPFFASGRLPHSVFHKKAAVSDVPFPDNNYSTHR